MDVGGIKICCPLIGVQSICGLVVTGFVLTNRQTVPNTTGLRSELTNVPRSYHTSEIYGFIRMAREYASRASRY